MDMHTKSAVDTTLAERGKRYGPFAGHAGITQAIKVVMGTGCRWDSLAADQREALEMIAHKIGRILNGDPDYADSWHDIAGYAKLVEDRLNTLHTAPEPPVSAETVAWLTEAHSAPRPLQQQPKWGSTGDWRSLEECDADPGQSIELCDPKGTVHRVLYNGTFPHMLADWAWRPVSEPSVAQVHLSNSWDVV
jgi:hypothetical protein